METFHVNTDSCFQQTETPTHLTILSIIFVYYIWESIGNMCKHEYIYHVNTVGCIKETDTPRHLTPYVWT